MPAPLSSPTTPFSPGSKTSGFTLMEAMVSVAIVCVLAVLILPASRSVIQSANAAKCLQNLKYIHTASLGYAADNNGILPFQPYGTGPQRMYKSPNAPRPNLLQDFIQPYNLNRNAFYSPGPLMTEQNRRWNGSDNNLLVTYMAFNNDIVRGAFDIDLRRLATAPGNKALWGCLTTKMAGSPPYRWWGGDTKEPPKFMTAVMVDGSAMKIPGSELRQVAGAEYYYGPFPE